MDLPAWVFASVVRTLSIFTSVPAGGWQTCRADPSWLPQPEGVHQPACRTIGRSRAAQPSSSQASYTLTNLPISKYFKPLSFGVVCYAADDWMQHKTPAGLGGSEHRTPREWKSGAKQHCLMNSWGDLRGTIKHRGRWHQWHRKSWSERTASSGYDCTWGVPYSQMHPERHSKELRSDLN